jgi:hypothetical protein
MKILLGGFSAEVSREDMYKLTIGNKSLCKISNDNGVRVVNFTTFINILRRLLKRKPTIRLTIFW